MNSTCRNNGIVPKWARSLAAAAMLLVGLANCAWAVMPPIDYPIKVNDPKLGDNAYRIIFNNEKIEYAQGVGNQVAHFMDGTTAVLEDAAGRFSMGTKAGAGFTSTDDNVALHGMHGWPSGNASYFDVGIGLKADTLTWAKYAGDGKWTTAPFIDITGRIMSSRWTTDGVLITQNVELIGSWAKISWSFKNTNAVGRYVDMRMIISQMLNIFNVPYVSVPGWGTIVSDTTITGTMPDDLSFLPTQQSLAPELKILLKGNGLSEPNMIQIGDHALPGGGRLGVDMDPNGAVPSRPVHWMGSMITYKPITIAAGATQTMSMMIGLGSSTLNAPAGSKFTAETECQRSLSLNSSMPGRYDPATFNIYGYTTNLHDETLDRSLDNVTMTISLPKGLELLAGESTSKTIATVDRGKTVGVNWKVKANTQAFGDLEYTINVKWDQMTYTVTRKVFVPMVPITDITENYQLKSFGFKFSNPLPTSVLGIADGAPVSDTYDMFGWDVAGQKYVAGDALAEITPASGYWMRVKNTADAGPKTLNGAISAGDPFGTTPYRVNLPATMKGWILIGNPYPFSVAIGNLRIFDRTTQNTLTIAQAIAQNKVRGTIFRWQPKAGSYPGGYQALSFVSQQAELLKPGDGYWMYISGNYLALEFYTSSVTGATQVWPSKSAASGWRISLNGSSTGMCSGTAAIGGNVDASDSEDGMDTPVPPKSPDTGVQISLAGGLAEDIRSMSGRKSWDLSVNVPAGTSSVELKWDGSRNVPSNLRLTLVDPSAGRNRDMRGTSSYVVDMAGQTTKTLKVVAEPAGSSALRINSVRVGRSRGGSVQLSYNLSDNATCSVRVMGANGSVVSTLTVAGSASRGVNTVTWNGQDANGINVPAGAYLMEISASTEDGQTAKTVQPVIMTR
ncbi:MAG: FlgD immunoglobulin-like domain containing protein [Armatimonadota bacterium]